MFVCKSVQNVCVYKSVCVQKCVYEWCECVFMYKSECLCLCVCGWEERGQERPGAVVVSQPLSPLPSSRLRLGLQFCSSSVWGVLVLGISIFILDPACRPPQKPAEVRLGPPCSGVPWGEPPSAVSSSPENGLSPLASRFFLSDLSPSVPCVCCYCKLLFTLNFVLLLVYTNSSFL